LYQPAFGPAGTKNAGAGFMRRIAAFDAALRVLCRTPERARLEMPTMYRAIATRVGVGVLLGCSGLSLSGCSGAQGASDGVVIPPGYVPRTIGFEARVGSEPFSCTGVYTLGTPPSVARPNQLRLFVSDLAVLEANGSATPVVLDENEWQNDFSAEAHSVALLDFDDASGNCRFSDADTHTEITGWVPGNPDFVGLSFRIGVPDVLNHRDAGLAPPPLNRPGLWWSQKDGQVSLRLELDSVNADSHRMPDVDDRTAPGGWQLWLAQTVVAAPYPRGLDPGAALEGVCGDVPCPLEQQPEVVLDAFDVARDRVVLDIGALLQDVDFTRTAFDAPPPADFPPSPSDPTITEYPMPDYAPGFFMERVDGEGAVVLRKLGIDWFLLNAPPDPSQQVFARRAE
jgi:uncharacterized repeat protein (TIGR04052 family)